MATLLAFWTPGPMEIVVLLILGLVLFGGNLPEVGKSVGRSLIEFRKGLKDLKSSAGLDEISKIKNDMLDMARDVDPRHMMDVDEEHLPDDPYKDAWQDGEYHEVETSKPVSDGDEAPASDEPGEDSGQECAQESGAESEDVSAEEDHEGEGSPLEGSHREPHEEDDPPTFGYDRHG